MSKIKFLKIRDVKSPSRGHDFDAGIDFFVPKFTKTFVFDLLEKNPQLFEAEESMSNTIAFSGSLNINLDSYNTIEDAAIDDEKLIKFSPKKGPYILIPPHNRIMIPSGIQSRMSEPGRALIGANKSGVSTKHGLIYGAHVIDYTYQGEIHISVINTSTKMVKIFQDQKLIQFIETPVIDSEIEITTAISESKILIDPYIKTEFWKDFKSLRKEDGFGSTDK